MTEEREDAGLDAAPEGATEGARPDTEAAPEGERQDRERARKDDGEAPGSHAE
jgi:hypothetical protein